MPELPEVKIMSNYINYHCSDKIFTKIYNVEKGNIPHVYAFSNFKISSDTNGKELILSLKSKNEVKPICVFMGMTGNWKWVETKNWIETKFTRLRLDDDSGMSLLLYGGYMGPKYKIGVPFNGTKRGPDPIKDFDKFKENILNNIHNKDFNNPIYEILLNQKYFNGIGNYIRSTILYYLNENPFQSAREIIIKRPEIINLCRDIPLKSYELSGGQLKDWINPFNKDSTEFKEWVFYKKGSSIKDSNNRTFWFDPKWKNNN